MPAANFSASGFFFPIRGKLGQHLALADDGAGDKLREKGDEKSIVKEGAALHLSPVRIHHEADLLEGEKADPQREQDALQDKGGPKDRIHVFHKKIIILEIKQHGQVAGHAERRRRSAEGHGARPRRPHETEHRIVEQDAAYHDQQIGRIKIPVKPQRKACQPQSGRRAFPQPRKQIKAAQAEGKKQEDKNIGIKQHRLAPNRFSFSV